MAFTLSAGILILDVFCIYFRNNSQCSNVFFTNLNPCILRFQNYFHSLLTYFYSKYGIQMVVTPTASGGFLFRDILWLWYSFFEKEVVQSMFISRLLLLIFSVLIFFVAVFVTIIFIHDNFNKNKRP